MTDTPEQPPVLSGPGIPVEPLDWRSSGFVAVNAAAFPDRDPTAHRVVKWYNDERVSRVPGQWAANDLQIRPACMDAEVDAGYIEMTPLYAQARGAVWCQDPACFPGVS